jgi:hypothetical protein
MHQMVRQTASALNGLGPSAGVGGGWGRAAVAGHPYGAGGRKVGWRGAAAPPCLRKQAGRLPVRSLGASVESDLWLAHIRAMPRKWMAHRSRV